MKIQQTKWTSGNWAGELKENQNAQIVFMFGSTSILSEKQPLIETVRKAFPKAVLFGCSTSGEILDTQVTDETLAITSVEFKSTRLQTAYATIKDAKDSFSVGQNLTKQLSKEELVHILVLSDGLNINGSDLVKGLLDELPEGVTVTGGLSGDGARFQKTLVFDAKGQARQDTVAAIGFYGKQLKVGYASLGGWDPFGPERVITRSKDNVLYELDGKSALELYKQYLGEHAKGLPGTGLLFPLSLRADSGATPVVRTILAVNEKDQSITFAGTMPQGAMARFMKANFDRLIDGAAGAAKASYSTVGSANPDLAILISCVGRKLILKQRIEEEVESVRDVLGAKTALTGFYSYGEISPFTPGAKCELHNQTMTITTFTET